MITRKHHIEEHGNQERWLLTYADMITLLAAFFLMMYSMSVMNKGKFTQFASSLRSGMQHSVLPGGSGITDGGQNGSRSAGGGQSGTLDEKGYRRYRAAMQDLQRFVDQSHLGGQVTTRADERGIVISVLSDGTLFEAGSADLRANNDVLLARIADILRTVPNNILVEGHTCNLPIRTAQFPSNWELSAARAGSVLRFFTEGSGLPARRFTAAGYADTRSILPNTSEGNRARNRRVDIVLVKTDAQREAELQRRSEIQRIQHRPQSPAVTAAANPLPSASSPNPSHDANGTAPQLAPSLEPRVIDERTSGQNTGVLPP